MLTDDLKYISGILDCTEVEEAWNLHTGKMCEYGFDRMIYGANNFYTRDIFDDHRNALVLVRHDADYVEPFFKQKWFRQAPMSVWAQNNTGTCSWRWALDRRARGLTTRKENDILDFNERHGVRAGYSISFPARSARSKSAIGLCAQRGLSQDDVDRIWAEHGDRIVLLNNLMDQKMALLPFAPPDHRLTRRQREVLEWKADGKTVLDIAQIMGLARSTVEKHLRLARETLDAQTTEQAVLMASRENQFFMLDRNRS